MNIKKWYHRNKKVNNEVKDKIEKIFQKGK